ncbi:MAG TPA: succinylglutamate desuccinylase/aspartoacylase family protein, partial [Xanthomonadales bacterium]|nr:succinylglutamate desuccinylase/aspartoacylase family protein [Xanthomonadales bacterium]
VNGRRAGPVMFVSAAVHGDELNGVEIVRRLLRLKALDALRGTLLAVPVVNIHGFLDQSRYMPDRRDLNRSFPGSPRGSIAARLAHTFVEHVVQKASFGIDLHTGAVDRANLPQVRANLDDPATQDIAMAFGAPVLINAAMREGSLRACAAASGIPMLVYEAGEALRFDELSIRAGLRGIMRVMRRVGMLPDKRHARKSSPVIARSTSWMRSPISGIVTGMVGLGRSVSKDEVIGKVSDPLGDQESEIISRFDGIVIGRSNLPLAHEGDALVHVAAFSDVERAADALEEFAAIHDPALGRVVESKLIGT